MKSFKYTKEDTVIAKELPPKLLEMGFRNGGKYRVYLEWITDSERCYYVTANHKNIRLQSVDGMTSGYASFFDLVEK